MPLVPPAPDKCLPAGLQVTLLPEELRLEAGRKGTHPLVLLTLRSRRRAGRRGIPILPWAPGPFR